VRAQQALVIVNNYAASNEKSINQKRRVFFIRPVVFFLPRTGFEVFLFHHFDNYAQEAQAVSTRFYLAFFYSVSERVIHFSQ
jgi:hypothetical protein